MHEIDAPQTSRAQSTRSLESAQRLNALRETLPRRSWREQVLREWDDWRAALQWSLGKQGNILLGQRLVGSLETAWWVLPDDAAQHWIRAAFEAVDEMTPRNVLARLNLALARLRIQHHRFNSCRLAAQRALGQALDVKDDVGVARARFLAGHSLVVLGSVAQGEKLLESALVQFRQLGARRSEGRTLASLAFARERANDVLSACSLCAKAVETLRSIEGEDGELDHISYLAELEFRAGNTEEALQRATEALAQHRKLREGLHIVVDLSNLAAYSIALDRYEDATKYAREALRLAVSEKDALWIAFAIQHLAAIETLIGGASRAARLLGFVDARISELERAREHTEEQEWQRAIAALRPRCADGDFERLLREGAQLSQDEAVAAASAAVAL